MSMPTSPPRRIVGFHQDDEGHWVADLECGHTRHVRHNPPWQRRPWVTSTAGRTAALGRSLGCKRCGDEAAQNRPETSPESRADT